jgi:membrane-associated protease RseP (regulator of RpoE activity)
MTSGLVAAALAALPMTAYAQDEPQNPYQPIQQNQQNQAPYQQRTPQTQSPQSQSPPQQQQTPTEEDTFVWSSTSGPRLGIMVNGMTPELRAYFGAPADRGVLIAKVARKSPAMRAGLHVGDVVTAVNGQPVSTADDVLEVLSDLQQGESFSIDVLRYGKPMTLQARIPGQQQQQPSTSSMSSSPC